MYGIGLAVFKISSKGRVVDMGYLYKLGLLTFCFFLMSCKQGSFHVVESNDNNALTDTTTTTTTTNAVPDHEGDPSLLTATEEFTQSFDQQKADILIVIDNSVSMNSYQNNLGSKFTNLTSSLSDIDWQIAFINTNNYENATSDGDQGSFYNLEDGSQELNEQILTPDMSNMENLFLNTISNRSTKDNNGQLGRGAEYPLANIQNAVIREDNSDFFRNNSTLVTIILANEGPDLTQAKEVVETVKDELGKKKRFFVYGIIPDNNNLKDYLSYKDEKCKKTINGQKDVCAIKGIKDLVKQTGGVSGDINATDYSEILDEISEELAASITYKNYKLKNSNVKEESIKVFFDDKEIEKAGNWRFHRSTNKIIFNNPVPDETHVRIEYKYEDE